MGHLSDDDIICMLILNAMNKDFGPLQHSISSLSHSTTFTSAQMGDRVRDEAAFICRCVDAGQSANPYSLSSPTPSSAFTAISSCARSPRPVCANCKKDTHGTDYCIAPNGKMAGRTIKEARAARLTARDKQTPHVQTAHVASPTIPSPVSSSSSNSDTIFLNGKLYTPVEPSWSSTSAVSSAHIAEVTSSDSIDFPYHAFVAFSDSAMSASSPNLFFRSSDGTLPFIIDSGASCHISPFLSDFKSIRPIKAHPITGLGDQSVTAVGIGSIELSTPLGTLSLHDALYVPASSARLLSVFLLGESNFNTHFYPREGHCFISDSNNCVVARGSALPDCKLFMLSSFSVPIHSHPHFSSTHYTSRLPDVDCWHKCLGHCGPRTVLDMARSHAVEGMRISSTSPVPKCPHCIIGKQTRSSVPKMREGARATRQLERVFLDLTGPMSLPSRTGCLYLMNIIDDYSSFSWSIPLRSKAEAAPLLKQWLTAMEVQTPHHLSSFVTDNGELASLQIQDWCSSKGILHLFTAPYTLAQNGHAERLHCTLLDKAQAMKSACNAPTDMWDEFCATAVYLTNLTGSTANDGKTPSELWHGVKPSVAHLCEIGCQAFALIPNHNPKINHRSLPCMLIGYAPNSKAYHLWDTSSNRIFNSYHVSFIESHERPQDSPVSDASTKSSAPPIHIAQPNVPAL